MSLYVHTHVLPVCCSNQSLLTIPTPPLPFFPLQILHPFSVSFRITLCLISVLSSQASSLLFVVLSSSSLSFQFIVLCVLFFPHLGESQFLYKRDSFHYSYSLPLLFINCLFLSLISFSCSTRDKSSLTTCSGTVID